MALLKVQPDTLRGRVITWYACQEHSATPRVSIILGLTLFVMAHLVVFCLLLKNYSLNVSVPLSFRETTTRCKP